MPGNNFLRTVTVTPTMDTSAYTANDVWFDRTVVTAACAAADQPTYLVGLTVIDQDDQTAADIRILILNDDVTIGTANAAPSMSDVNGLTIMADILIASADWHDMGGFKIVRVDPAKLPIPIMHKDGTANIYIAGICGGTPTQTASGVKIRLWFQDTYPF